MTGTEIESIEHASGLDAPLPVHPARPWLISFADLICVLLSFFVLLANISKVEATKARDAMHSIGETLAFGTPGEASRFAPPPEAEAFVTQQAVRAELAGRIQAVVPNVKMEDVPARSELRFSVPASLVFDGANIKASAQPIVAAVATALKRNVAGFKFHGEAALAEGADAAANRERIAEAGLIARSLITAGAPTMGVAAVLDHGDPGDVRFTVRAEADDAPRIDFSRLVPQQ